MQQYVYGRVLAQALKEVTADYAAGGEGGHGVDADAYNYDGVGVSAKVADSEDDTALFFLFSFLKSLTMTTSL